MGMPKRGAVARLALCFDLSSPVRERFSVSQSGAVVNRRDSTLSLAAEARRLQGMRRIDPYDRSTCEALAEVLFDMYRGEHPIGSLARGRHLLEIIGGSFPTPRLTAAY